MTPNAARARSSRCSEGAWDSVAGRQFAGRARSIAHQSGDPSVAATWIAWVTYLAVEQAPQDDRGSPWIGHSAGVWRPVRQVAAGSLLPEWQYDIAS